MMNAAMNQGESVNVVFVDQKNEVTEKAVLNTAQLTALLNANQVWVEKFSQTLKIKNTVWSYGNGQILLQIYLD